VLLAAPIFAGTMTALMLQQVCAADAPVISVAGFNPAEVFPAFANETVFAYDGADVDAAKTARPYKRRCFVLCRAVLQFWKFARYDGSANEIADDELARAVRGICRVPVWSRRGDAGKTVLPGFRSFRDLTARKTQLVQTELGGWLPAYTRPGNWRMGFPIPRSGQARLARELERAIERGDPRAVYLTRFHRLNHCVVAYSFRKDANGDVEFGIYDPNLPDQYNSLRYIAETRSFELPKVFYWKGGRVNALAVYISPLH
jgi:hypothetical protein